MRPTRSRSLFTRFTKWTAHATGRPLTFAVAVLVIAVWALTGPLFGFSDTWQLVINTGTTVVTFLMVFLIQHTQNRDALAMHLKLDELVRMTQGADARLIDAEDETDEELAELKRTYAALLAEQRGLREHLARHEG